MSKDDNIFNDIAKLANSALATTSNMKNELTKLIKHQIESFIKSMDFVKREEFEVVKKMATQNAIEIEKLTGKKIPTKGPQSKEKIKKTTAAKESAE